MRKPAHELKTRSNSKRLTEIALIGATSLRLVLAGIMAHKASEGQSILGEMVLFVAADILDGVVARRLSLDTPRRRIVDGVVDKLSIAGVAWAVTSHNHAALPYSAALVTRELVVGGVNLRHYLKEHEVVQGTGVHKLGPLSTALFGVAAASGNSELTNVTGLLAATTNTALLVDYLHNAIQPQGSVTEGIRQISFTTSNDG